MFFFPNFLHSCIFLWWFYLYTTSHQSRAFIQIFYYFLLHLFTQHEQGDIQWVCVDAAFLENEWPIQYWQRRRQSQATHKLFLSKSHWIVTPMNDFSVPTSTTSVLDMASPSHLSHAPPVPLSFTAPHDRCSLLPRPQLPGPAFV